MTKRNTAYTGRMPPRPRPCDHEATPARLFTPIDHVGVAVPDLDDAIAFY